MSSLHVTCTPTWMHDSTCIVITVKTHVVCCCYKVYHICCVSNGHQPAVPTTWKHLKHLGESYTHNHTIDLKSLLTTHGRVYTTYSVLIYNSFHFAFIKCKFSLWNSTCNMHAAETYIAHAYSPHCNIKSK